MVQATKPLQGVRVLDLTNVLAGPFCCHQLAHLGADVIKVEMPGRGDLARQLGADPALSARNMGVSFLAQNAGKKSVTLNLKDPKGKDLLMELVETADVLVENFRPGVMTRLGLGYEQLRRKRSSLIYCAISGFGQDGPWVERPAYDQIVQGLSGAMSITGDEETAPLRVGYPMADTIGGLTAAMAISAALNAPERGGFIDVSMLESVIATMGWVVSNHLVAGVEPRPFGNENMTSAPSGTFEAADGLLNIAANKEEQWRLLVQHLDRQDLLERPEFTTREDRKLHRSELKRELDCALQSKSARQWARELSEIGVPAGAVMRLPDVLAHPQIADRGLIADFPTHDETKPMRLLRTAVKMDGEAASVDAPPPELGQHNELIYQELGYSTDEIANMKKQGVI